MGKTASDIVNSSYNSIFHEKQNHSHKSTWIIFGSIIFAAFLIRFLYLLEIKSNPFFLPVVDGIDPDLYHSMAIDISRGNLMGEEVFHSLPLYPYFLGFIYYLLGPNVFIAKIVQCFIGSVNCGLIFLIGKRIFNRPIGIIAGSLFAFHRLAIYFEGFLISPFLAIFFNLLIILILTSLNENAPKWKWFLIGTLIGLSALSSASIIIFIPFLIYWIYKTFNHNKNILIKGLICFMAFMSILSMVTIRNYIVSKEFVPISAHGGITFYAGNNIKARGVFKLPKSFGGGISENRKNAKLIAQKELNRSLSSREVSDFWFRKAFGFIKKNPPQYVQLVINKIYLFWNVYEIPDIFSSKFFERYSSILKMPLVRYGFFVPLTLLGIFLTRTHKNSSVQLLIFHILSVLIATTIFFVNSRYRYIAAPSMAIFSSISLYWIYIQFKNRNILTLFKCILIALILYFLFRIPIVAFSQKDERYNLASFLAMQGKHHEAIEELQSLIRDNPNFHWSYYRLGLSYMELGRYEEAVAELEEAIHLNPNLNIIYNELAKCYLILKDRKQAVKYLTKSLELDPSQNNIRKLIEKYQQSGKFI